MIDLDYGSNFLDSEIVCCTIHKCTFECLDRVWFWALKLKNVFCGTISITKATLELETEMLLPASQTAFGDNSEGGLLCF